MDCGVATRTGEIGAVDGFTIKIHPIRTGKNSRVER
jgi:hypothetical protein